MGNTSDEMGLEELAKSIGQPIALVREWETVMSGLFYLLSKKGFEQKDGMLKKGSMRVFADMVNSKYIVVKVEAGGEELLTVKNLNHAFVIKVVLSYIEALDQLVGHGI